MVRTNNEIDDVLIERAMRMYRPRSKREAVEDAADVDLACRQAGDTVRALTDCLIASVAMRTGLAVLHTDRDFDTIARHAPLELA